MITKGQQTYEKYRRHEPDAEPWSFLDQETRLFWERLAVALEKQAIRV